MVFKCPLPSCNGLLFESEWGYKEHLQVHEDERCVVRCRLGCLNVWFVSDRARREHHRRIHGSSFDAAASEAEIDTNSSSALVRVHGKFKARTEDLWELNVPAVFGRRVSAERRCAAAECGGLESIDDDSFALHILEAHIHPRLSAESNDSLHPVDAAAAKKASIVVAARRCPAPECRDLTFKTGRLFAIHMEAHVPIVATSTVNPPSGVESSSREAVLQAARVIAETEHAALIRAEDAAAKGRAAVKEREAATARSRAAVEDKRRAWQMSLATIRELQVAGNVAPKGSRQVKPKNTSALLPGVKAKRPQVPAASRRPAKRAKVVTPRSSTSLNIATSNALPAASAVPHALATLPPGAAQLVPHDLPLLELTRLAFTQDDARYLGPHGPVTVQYLRSLGPRKVDVNTLLALWRTGQPPQPPRSCR